MSRLVNVIKPCRFNRPDVEYPNRPSLSAPEVFDTYQPGLQELGTYQHPIWRKASEFTGEELETMHVDMNSVFVGWEEREIADHPHVRDHLGPLPSEDEMRAAVERQRQLLAAAEAQAASLAAQRTDAEKVWDQHASNNGAALAAFTDEALKRAAAQPDQRVAPNTRLPAGRTVKANTKINSDSALFQ